MIAWDRFFMIDVGSVYVINGVERFYSYRNLWCLSSHSTTSVLDPTLNATKLWNNQSESSNEQGVYNYDNATLEREYMIITVLTSIQWLS